MPGFAPLVAKFYERSGWPVVLANVVREAWRRYRAGELAEDEFYDAESAMESIFGGRRA